MTSLRRALIAAPLAAIGVPVLLVIALGAMASGLGTGVAMGWLTAIWLLVFGLPLALLAEIALALSLRAVRRDPEHAPALTVMLGAALMGLVITALARLATRGALPWEFIPMGAAMALVGGVTFVLLRPREGAAHVPSERQRSNATTLLASLRPRPRARGTNAADESFTDASSEV